MKLKYNDKEIELVYSFRSAIYFEQITNKNIDFSNITANDVLTLFYCVFIASLQKNKMPICTMLDFLDVVDENGGDKCIVDFSNWYVSILTAQYELLNSTYNEDESSKNVKTKKKKN